VREEILRAGVRWFAYEEALRAGGSFLCFREFLLRIFRFEVIACAVKIWYNKLWVEKLINKNKYIGR